MGVNEVKTDLLSQLLYEAQAYKKFEDIEKLVDGGRDLSMVPIQPLYVSLQNTSKDQVALVLPKLSIEQRQALRDIDLWEKDTFDPESGLYWLEVYGKCPDDKVVLEYLQTEDFLLALKSKFNVSTFDAEDPMYPDGDNYFLTEDNLLLIEYPEDFAMVNELKEMVRKLYAEQGVENAYAFLFKMVVDSYQLMEENNYQEKIDRLRDFGFVDYFEALEHEAPFGNEAQLQTFIKNKKGLTPELDAKSANQGLHASSLVPYQAGLDGMKAALEKVEDEKRQQFLHFNFIRLVNGRMALTGALKGGAMAMTRTGNQTKQALELGLEYAQAQLDVGKRDKVFEIFDFLDLYRIGHGLLDMNKRKLKKAMAATPFENDETAYFLGAYWNAFLENSYDEVVKYKFDGSTTALEVKDLRSFELWSAALETFVAALPFVHTFHKSLENLKAENLLNDEFYLNYQVDNIDFESIMISSFINFIGQHYEHTSAGKMGVTVDELKDFYHRFFIKNGEEYLIKGEEDPVLREKTLDFIRKFGMDKIPFFDRYLYQVMLEQLNGYEIDKMDGEDFRHIGGPILLSSGGS